MTKAALSVINARVLVVAAAFALISLSSSRSFATTTPQAANLSLQHFQYDPETYDLPFDRLTWYLLPGGVFPSSYDIYRLKNRASSGETWELVDTIVNPSQLTDEIVFTLPLDPVGTIYDYIVTSRSSDGGFASSNKVSYASLIVDGDFSSATFPDPYWRLLGTNASILNDSLSGTYSPYGYATVGGQVSTASGIIMSSPVAVLGVEDGFTLDTATVNIAGHIGDVTTSDTGAAHDPLVFWIAKVDAKGGIGSAWSTTVATSLSTPDSDFSNDQVPYSAIVGRNIEVRIESRNDAALPTSYAFTYLELNVVLKYTR